MHCSKFTKQITRQTDRRIDGQTKNHLDHNRIATADDDDAAASLPLCQDPITEHKNKTLYDGIQTNKQKTRRPPYILKIPPLKLIFKKVHWGTLHIALTAFSIEIKKKYEENNLDIKDWIVWGALPLRSCQIIAKLRRTLAEEHL